MIFNAKDYELPGQFYLGASLDEATGQRSDLPFLYDSADLTTHAICVGMTGSGKTGLGIALLEEAAIDGIPALVIDPKGDLADLALQFPDLKPSDFEPWISPDQAAREQMTPAAFAEAQARLWREGLAKWGEDGARIARLKEAAEVTVYTPGSTAGVPVSIIRSLEVPPPEIANDPELLGSHIETTVASLLGLLGIPADPSRSREGVFLSTLLHYHWDQGRALDLPALAHEIQKPPFSEVGVLDVEAFYPEKDRFQLLLALNSLLASPSFKIWQQGAPLDIQSFLYTPEGKPRLAVFSIAHLTDSERMFFVSMLLSATLSWVRTQPGSSSLRALLYMDEIFGYFPPTANPPSKKPLLTLLKQARAFGFGVVLATQNPADLDYKGLANAGTWFIGRLQTERDKLRLLDGLAGLGLDRGEIDTLLSRLKKRAFLMNNVHESKPLLFETRWTLSYLCGPLTRDQIRRLPKRVEAVKETPKAPTPRGEASATSSSRAPLVQGVRQIYAKTGESVSPMLLGTAKVRYRDAKTKQEFLRSVAIAAAFPMDALSPVEWSEAIAVNLDDFSSTPSLDTKHWGDAPPEALRAVSYKNWEREFFDWLVTRYGLTLYFSPLANQLSVADETEGSFRTRIAPALREARDRRLAALREEYAKKGATLAQRLDAAQQRLRNVEARAGEGRLQTFISAGSTLVSLFLGRKKLSTTTLSKAATTARGVSRTVKQGDDLEAVRQKVLEQQAAIGELDEALRVEMERVREEYDPLITPLEPRELMPTRTGSRVEWLALAWMP